MFAVNLPADMLERFIIITDVARCAVLSNHIVRLVSSVDHEVCLQLLKLPMPSTYAVTQPDLTTQECKWENGLFSFVLFL